jgi:site-specific DNA-methyltransferase (adenine-specific)
MIVPTCKILIGDCLESMRAMPDNSVDSIVTDPPYGLSFMGKKWDYDVPSVEIWAECLRVLKPGGHLLAFAGTRTQHRMACRIEDAGFEIRDMIAWCYGSGFPKSKNVALSIDKGEGHPNRGHRIAVANRNHPDGTEEPNGEVLPAYEAKSEAGKQWEGWGTALKPALEPITVARKPLAGTVSANVLEHGTGGLNIDGCRVGTEKVVTTNGKGFKGSFEGGENNNGGAVHEGRWPANLIHDGSDDVVGMFPVTTSGGGGQPQSSSRSGNAGLSGLNAAGVKLGHGDSGSAARFFYCAKADKSDRGHGNNHPTVKPNDLMRYLVRLVTPPGGTVLDPFAGSGSTGKAALEEGFSTILCEREPEHAETCRRRTNVTPGLGI